MPMAVMRATTAMGATTRNMRTMAAITSTTAIITIRIMPNRMR